MEDKEQYFLVNEGKIQGIIDALHVHHSDEVLELGSGKGTVSRRIPYCRHLILDELDHDLCHFLRHEFGMHSHIDILQEDGIQLLRDHLNTDRILSHLPSSLTDDLMETLKDAHFHRAIVCVREDEDLSRWRNDFDMKEVEILNSNDFEPNQPFRSTVYLIRHKQVTK